MSKKKQTKQDKHKAPTRKAGAEPAVDAALEVNADVEAAAASGRVKRAKTKPDAASESVSEASAKPDSRKAASAKAPEKSAKKAGAKRTAVPEVNAEGAVELTPAGKGASAKVNASKANAAKPTAAKTGSAKAGAAKVGSAKAGVTKATDPKPAPKAPAPSSKSKRAQAAVKADPEASSGSSGEALSLSFANSPFADGDAEPAAPEAAEPSAVEATLGKAKAAKKLTGKASPKRAAQQANAGEASAEVKAEAPAALASDAELAPDAEPQADELEPSVDAALAEDEWAEEADEAGAIAASLLEQEPGVEDADPDEPELSDEETNQRYLKGLIEALLFSAEKPLTLRELARAARLDKKRTTELLKEVTRDFRKRGMNVVEIAGGFGFRSNPAYAPYVQKLLSLRPVRLSRAQLETLAVIAYRQPVTRPEVDDVRGVDSGQVIKGLLDRDLIKMLGKKDEVGRPMLYGTTPAFLELFSLESLKDLPNLREFTELSDDSREKFKDAMGEAAPGGVAEELSALEADAADGSASATVDDTDGDAEFAEPPLPEVSLAGSMDNEVPSDSDVEIAEPETSDEADVDQEPVTEATASETAAVEVTAEETADALPSDAADVDEEASEGELLDSELEVESDSLG